MRRITINERNIESVNVIDDVVEICVRESSGWEVLVYINQEAWDEICKGKIEGMERGASTGEQKREPDGKWLKENLEEGASPGEDV